MDLRDDPEMLAELARDGKKPLKYVDGLKLQRNIHAHKYMECSAKTLNNVHEVFQEAARAGLRGMEPKKKKKTCTIL